MTEQVVYVPMEGITTCLSVSASTVRNCMKDGRIPSDLYFKVGKNYRFNLAAIIELFKSQTPAVTPPAQVEAKQEVIETVQKVSENPLQEPAPVQLQFDFDADLDI